MYSRGMYDVFEYRKRSNEDSYFLFNRFTGEVVLDSNDYLNFNRHFSLWMPAEEDITRETNINNLDFPAIWLRPCTYQSKITKAISNKDITAERAIIKIQAAIRGHKTRLDTQQIIRDRYYKSLADNGFFYFVDSTSLTSSWYKPRLAYPDGIHSISVPESVQEDIVTLETDDKHQVVVKNDLYSSINDHLMGPFKRRYGAGQKSTVRVVHDVFYKENPKREIAVTHPSGIDTNEKVIAESFLWLDQVALKEILIDDYALMRSAYSHHQYLEGCDWKQVLDMIEKYRNRPLISLYALRNFSKASIPIDSSSGLLDEVGVKALNFITAVLVNEDNNYSLTHIVFALEALYNFLAVRAGRAEYMSTIDITVVGFLRKTAILNHLKLKLGILHRYLSAIQTEEIIMPSMVDIPDSLTSPTTRGCDIASLALTCLDCLARDPSSQELIAEVSTAFILKSLEICCEDPSVTLSALRVLYSICYRNEGGQRYLLDMEDRVRIRLEHVKNQFPGDRMIEIQVIRVEESLKNDGWRGLYER